MRFSYCEVVFLLGYLNPANIGFGTKLDNRTYKGVSTSNPMVVEIFLKLDKFDVSLVARKNKDFCTGVG